MYIDLEIELEFKNKKYIFTTPYGWNFPNHNNSLTREEIEENLDEYVYHDDYEPPTASQLWTYWWIEGNGGCDCNRSKSSGIAKEYPELCRLGEPCFPCGNSIKLLRITPLKETIREVR